MQEERAAVEIVLRGISSLLEWTASANPNRAKLEQARRYTQESQNEALTCPERSALLRVASTHLKAADVEQRDRAVSEMLALTRLALTAALFDIGPGRPLTPARAEASRASSHEPNAESPRDL